MKGYTQSEEQFVCETCGKEFDKEHGARMHVINAHNRKKKAGRPSKVEESAGERKPARKPAVHTGPSVHYCPCCGINLTALQYALNTLHSAEGR